DVTGHVAGQGGVAERQRAAIVVDSPAFTYPRVVGDGGTADRQGAVVVEAAAGLVAEVIGDGAVEQRQRSIIENAAAVIAAALLDGEAAQDRLGPGIDLEYPGLVVAADRNSAGEPRGVDGDAA